MISWTTIEWDYVSMPRHAFRRNTYPGVLWVLNPFSTDGKNTCVRRGKYIQSVPRWSFWTHPRFSKTVHRNSFPFMPFLQSESSSFEWLMRCVLLYPIIIATTKSPCCNKMVTQHGMDFFAVSLAFIYWKTNSFVKKKTNECWSHFKSEDCIKFVTPCSTWSILCKLLNSCINPLRHTFFRGTNFYDNCYIRVFGVAHDESELRFWKFKIAAPRWRS